MNLTAKRKPENSLRISRHLIWRAMTVLMFFYLCADVTVLEYFCGNPSLGIASYREVVEIKSPPAEKLSQTSFAQNRITDSRSSKQDGESEIPIDGDDCFCCSSHAIVSYTSLIVTPKLVFSRPQAPNFSRRQNSSEWHFPPFFRPPRTV